VFVPNAVPPGSRLLLRQPSRTRSPGASCLKIVSFPWEACGEVDTEVDEDRTEAEDHAGDRHLLLSSPGPRDPSS